MLNSCSELSKHIQYLFVLSVSLAVLASCTIKKAPDTSDSELETILVPTLTESSASAIDTNPENFCTDLGCSSGLYVSLLRVPQEYIAIAEDDQNNKVIIQCFEKFEGRHPITFKDYFFNNLKLNDLSNGIGSEAKAYCGDDEPGVMRVWTQNNGMTESIIVVCPMERTSPGNVMWSTCSDKELSVKNFTPDKLDLTLLAGERRKTTTLNPFWYVHQPNGPDCEPICRIHSMTLSLP